MSLMKKVLEYPNKHFETKFFSKIAVARKVYFYRFSPCLLFILLREKYYFLYFCEKSKSNYLMEAFQPPAFGVFTDLGCGAFLAAK